MNKQKTQLRETASRWMKLANVPEDNAKKFLKENLDALQSNSYGDEDEELDMGSDTPDSSPQDLQQDVGGGEQTLELTPEILNAMKKVAEFVKQIEGSVDISGDETTPDLGDMGDEAPDMGGEEEMSEMPGEEDELPGEEGEEGELEDEEEDKEQLDETEAGLLSDKEAGGFLSKGGNKHKEKAPQSHKMSKLSESEKRKKVASYLADKIVTELAKERLKAKTGKKDNGKKTGK